MPIVVTVYTDPIHGVSVEAFGPWDQEACERERRRRLADFAYRCPWGSARHRLTVAVVPVRDEVVAP